MTTATSPLPAAPASRQSLYITSIVAVVAIGAGWLIGNQVAYSPTEVTAGGVDFELPAGWTLVEETETQVVFAPSGVPRGEAVVVYLAGSPEASGGVEGFVETSPERLLLFTVDSSDDQVANFRYVQVDRLGGPDEIMGGRFLAFGEVAAVVFAPRDALPEALADFDLIIGQIE